MARARWPIEQQYRELKDELGLDHFEGRSYRGWTHHTSQSGFHKVAVDCYFCVSLAEAHTDGYCYKLIAAVLTKHPL